MALYAFDGTGNEDKPGDDEDTNVLKFFRAYEGGNNFYVEGVGTRHWIVGSALGGALGLGAKERIDEALAALEDNFEAGDESIDIIGFSRGAALALEFANEIFDDGINGVAAPPIRFMGLWDTVASFGIPGNNINIGIELTVPENVEACCHAVSLDERRRTFPLTRMTQDKFSGRDLIDIREVWFRGYHSDVGGGNKNEGLSNIALHWMYQRAMAAALPLRGALVEEARDGSDPATDPKTPGMDRKANKKRTIRATDVVHESVTRIARAGRFPANNPPKGLAVMGDNGALLANRFEE